MKASWNGAVLAESDHTVVVENNHYFPMASINPEFFKPSSHSSHCRWKGDASYYSLEVSGKRNENAAWYYPDPLPAAAGIKGHVAFWKGVKVEE